MKRLWCFFAHVTRYALIDHRGLMWRCRTCGTDWKDE